MRFLSLGLDRYGRFSDRRLDFDPKARLVVVLGANEAGKTTALAAARDALFGIDERSPFNFLHDYKAMRLSATIQGPDGRTLSFARLKRRKAALVEPDGDTPLPDDILAPFLGAHDRDAFLDIFGLNQERLRDGGRKLLAGGGDLAQTLIAAAPGLGRVAVLRDQMKAEAAAVFNPARASASAVFYAGLAQLKEAQRRIQDNELRGDVVKAARAAAQDAAAARAAAVAADIEAALAANRAESLLRAAKELRIIAAQQMERDSLGPLPQVEAGFATTAREQLAAQIRAREAEAAATQAETQAAAARAAITLDTAILALTDEITRRDEERVQVEDKRASLPNRQREADAARVGLARIAAALGLEGVEAVRAGLPGQPLLARAGTLVDRLRDHATRQQALADEAEALARRRRAAAAGDVPRMADPAPLKRQLDALDGAETRAAHLDELAHRLDAARATLEARLARLPFGPWSRDALLRRPLPDRAGVDAALSRLVAATEAHARSREQCDDLAEQAAQLEGRRQVLDAAGTAPTAQAIAGARGVRDGLWLALRPALLGQRPVQGEDATQAEAFEQAVAAADRLTDDRQRESRRLADLARAELDLAELAARRTAAAPRLTAAEAALSAARDHWQQLWAPAGLAPPADAGALAFLGEVEALRAALDALDQQAAEMTRLGEAHAWDRSQAEALRAALALPPLALPPLAPLPDPAPSLSPGRAPSGAPSALPHPAASLRMGELRAAVAEREEAFRLQRDQERDRARLDETAADLAARCAQLESQHQALAAERAEVLPPLAIRAEAPPDEARAALDLWHEAATHASALATAERRIAGIEQDEARFLAALESLLGQLGLAAQGDPFTTTRALRARLDAARQAQTRAEAADAALAERAAVAAAARAARARAEATLGEILARAGVTDAAQLAGRIDQLERAAVCDAALAAARARLDDVRGDRSVAQIESAIAGHTDEELARQAAEAVEAHRAAGDARDVAVERATETRTALEALMGDSAAAAAAAQEAQDALAGIEAAMGRFTQAHVTARLLTFAIERYREAHQNPIVARAAEAFATLTDGRWSGIAVDYDADPPRLAASQGERLHAVGALSEGTADQLFLALRVAAIEDHAQRATPLPFLADDLFVTFDEVRTEAGLRLLAELGAITQVIVFTHHVHVAEAARRALGPAAAVIDL